MGFFSNLFGGGSNNDLAKTINDDALLVDVRSFGEFASGNVKGSINIPVDQITNHLAKFKAKDNNIVVFCRSGMRSSQAKSILEKNGFTNVTNGGTWEKVDNLLE
jgi:phage shock protein E